MPATELKQRWANGEATYGAVVRIGHSWAPEVFAAAGLDFVWVDLQHGFVPIDTLLPIFQSMNGTRATPMARVPSNDAAIIGTVRAGTLRPGLARNRWRPAKILCDLWLDQTDRVWHAGSFGAGRVPRSGGRTHDEV